MVRRYAFTMIELIFAIVVISIVVISLPVMNRVISKGIEQNLAQEAIFASSVKLNEIISYPWDENSTKGNILYSRVIWTNANDCNSSTKLRQGHIMEPLHRRCLDSNSVRPTAEAMLGKEGSSYNDIDDFNSLLPQTDIFINSTPSADGYKNKYTMDINVAYADFNDTNESSHNIKKITITVKDDNNNTVTKLHTYSANIGEVDYYKRSY